LLESIIGKEFLPKGKGIVTRRPIEIQLSQISSEKEYGEMVEKKGEFYENMDDFRRVIEAETDKACGGNKGISNVPLRVRFYSKKVLNLLLVDLPGIVKVIITIERIQRAINPRTSRSRLSR
jgi:dynamin 1-like protein